MYPFIVESLERYFYIGNSWMCHTNKIHKQKNYMKHAKIDSQCPSILQKNLVMNKPKFYMLNNYNILIFITIIERS